MLYSEKAKAKFFSVLKFPFGGWMCEIKNYDVDDMIDDDLDEENEDEQHSDENNENHISEDDDMNTDEAMDSSKKAKKSQQGRNLKNQHALKLKELNSMRKIYLPNICFLLLDMFIKMNLNKDLIRLTDLISAETYKIYALFEKQQLKCFLNKTADASIILLDANSDYLGY